MSDNTSTIDSKRSNTSNNEESNINKPDFKRFAIVTARFICILIFLFFIGTIGVYSSFAASTNILASFTESVEAASSLNSTTGTTESGSTTFTFHPPTWLNTLLNQSKTSIHSLYIYNILSNVFYYNDILVDFMFRKMSNLPKWGIILLFVLILPILFVMNYVFQWILFTIQAVKHVGDLFRVVESKPAAGNGVLGLFGLNGGAAVQDNVVIGDPSWKNVKGYLWLALYGMLYCASFIVFPIIFLSCLPFVQRGGILMYAVLLLMSMSIIPFVSSVFFQFLYIPFNTTYTSTGGESTFSTTPLTFGTFFKDNVFSNSTALMLISMVKMLMYTSTYLGSSYLTSAVVGSIAMLLVTYYGSK